MRGGRTALGKEDCNGGGYRGKIQLVDDLALLQLTNTSDDASCIFYVMYKQWLLLAKSFEVKFNVTEKSCDSCAKFQVLAVKCQYGLYS